MSNKELPPLSERAQRAIAAEKQHSGPPPDFESRLLRRLSTSLGQDNGGNGPNGDGTTPDASAAGTTQASPLVAGAGRKVTSRMIAPWTMVTFGAGVLVGAGVFAVIHSYVPHGPDRGSIQREIEWPAVEPTLSSKAEITTRDSGATASTDSNEKQPTEAVRLVRSSGGRRARTTQKTKATLAQERALLEMARAALARGKHQAALRALREHRRRFRRGKLSEERDATEVITLSNLGRAAEALRRAQAFKRRYPQSMLGPAVTRATEKLR